MTNSIYTKKFIAESESAIIKIDNALSLIEEGINELLITYDKLTPIKKQNLAEISKTNVSDYNDKITRMYLNLMDFYSYKNDLIEHVEELKLKTKSLK